MRTDRALFRDSFLAAVLAAAAVALFVVSRGGGAAGAALLVLAYAPVAVRRRWPLAALCAVQAPIAVLAVLDGEPGLAGPAGLILLYSVAAHRGLAIALSGLAVTAVGYATAVSLSPSAPAWPDHAMAILIGIAVWGAGRSLRLRRAYLEELKDRAARLERAREADTRAARAEERSRIARELHDVVAHHVSVMTVQAAAARKVLTANPEVAREALSAIEETGRLAMNEMRNIVGVLRTDAVSGPPERRPQPGLRDLPALVEQMREAGLPTELEVEGQAAVPAGLDLAAYRLVQEGLTNSLRHAGPGAHARVSVRQAPRELSLVVEDDGLGPEAREGDRTGHGLVGIRERVALYGGILRVGPRTGGGFEVRAIFPLKDG
ncbi:sensor histidine kinase [Nonomuraea sp. NPDC059194]|uniref:sensor histidine kinase n=1 Tax=Nonomuraea sp. NPDC059194 TaxID=3346764 RepID=UPI00369ECBFC